MVYFLHHLNQVCYHQYSCTNIPLLASTRYSRDRSQALQRHDSSKHYCSAADTFTSKLTTSERHHDQVQAPDLDLRRVLSRDWSHIRRDRS
jgi:hypothetical protein